MPEQNNSLDSIENSIDTSAATEAVASTDASENTEAVASTDASENTEAVTSTGGVDDESVTVSMEKEPWPEGGVDSFTNHALPSLIFGMLGIFLVLGLIAIATVSLNKLFPGKKEQ